MLALLFALAIGMTHFGNHDEIPAPQYDFAPLTWEDAPEAMIELTSNTTDTRYGWVHYVSPEGIEWTKDDTELYRTLNRCDDSDPVYVDVVTGAIYGDQDGNGRLDGDDCNWN